MKSRTARVNPSLAAWIAGFCLALLVAAPAPAEVRAADIEEVVAGAYGRPEIQYVELRLDDLCRGFGFDQAILQLAAYDAADQEVGTFVFPQRFLPCNPFTLLVATQAFADLPGAPTPDVLMPALLVPDSGKVCFAVPSEGYEACLTYGGFAGETHQGSPFNAPPLSAAGTCSLRIDNPAAFGDAIPFNADYDLLPPEPRNSADQTGVLTVPPRFTDVAATSPYLPFVEALFNAGVTGGCGNGGFCPAALVSREQMAVFLLLAREGAAFQPPACAAPVFADVPCTHPFAPWINELAARGVTGGCGGGYCPGAAVSRAQMAVFLLLMAEGPGFQPPVCASPLFADVPCSDPFAPWINELAARGVTGGCGGGNYCPGGLVSREQMAVFLSTVFALPVPSRSCLLPPRVDDHGDTAADATPVVPVAARPGLRVAGDLERPRDVDVFSFPAQSGEAFLLAISAITGEAPEVELTVQGPDGSLGILAEGSSMVGFTAPSGGAYFVSVRDSSGRRVGGYEVFVRGPVADDHGGGAADATPLVPGGPSVAGEIGRPGDSDAFSFAATAGQVYVVEAVGLHPEMSISLQITNSTGFTVVHDVLVGEPIERLAFRAASTSTYFAHVRHSFSAIGLYEIRVRGPVADDHGGTPGTATPLASAAPVDGEVLPVDDVDLFSFTGAAGEAFLVSVEVLAPSPALAEAHVVNSGGAVLATVVLGKETRVRFDASGTLFVRLRPLRAAPVSCRVTLEGPVPDDHGDTMATATSLTPGPAFLTAHHELPDDVDFFSFPAVAGQSILVEVEGQGNTAFVLLDDQVRPVDGLGNSVRIETTAPKTGTFFVLVRHSPAAATGDYRIRIRTPVADDHGNRPSQSTPLVPNVPPREAELELTGDADLFSFEALAGEVYVIKTEGDRLFGSGVQTTLLAEDGLTALGNGIGWSSLSRVLQIRFSAPRTGRFFVRIADLPQTYRISLAGPFSDDHGNTPAAATLLTVDGPAVPGVIESAADVDVFAFDAVAGETVTVETGGLGQGLDTLLEIEDAGGTVLASDDDGGVDLGSRVTLTVPVTGRYVARVTSFPGTTGTYHISARR